MKIYAIRDRLIDYYLVPFCAPDEKQVMASISQDISRPDNPNAIASAPHHFEIHQLGVVNDDGTITPEKQFICDVSSLIRAGRESTQPKVGMAEQPTQTPPRPNGRSGGNASTDT